MPYIKHSIRYESIYTRINAYHRDDGIYYIETSFRNITCTEIDRIEFEIIFDTIKRKSFKFIIFDLLSAYMVIANTTHFIISFFFSLISIVLIQYLELYLFFVVCFVSFSFSFFHFLRCVFSSYRVLLVSLLLPVAAYCWYIVFSCCCGCILLLLGTVPCATFDGCLWKDFQSQKSHLYANLHRSYICLRSTILYVNMHQSIIV